MQMFYVTPTDPTEAVFALCGDHYQDRAAGLLEVGYSVVEGRNPNTNTPDECVDCLESGWDDGDYPGVERDENMSRIEGDDFWSGGYEE